PYPVSQVLSLPNVNQLTFGIPILVYTRRVGNSRQLFTIIKLNHFSQSLPGSWTMPDTRQALLYSVSRRRKVYPLPLFAYFSDPNPPACELRKKRNFIVYLMITSGRGYSSKAQPVIQPWLLLSIKIFVFATIQGARQSSFRQRKI